MRAGLREGLKREFQETLSRDTLKREPQKRISKDHWKIEPKLVHEPESLNTANALPTALKASAAPGALFLSG